MKTKLFSILTVVAILFLSSCEKERIKPSSEITTEETSLNDFHQIEVSNRDYD